MAIGFRQASSGDLHFPGTTTTITKPTGFASTDVLVAFFGTGNGASLTSTVTAPTGWTAISAGYTVSSGVTRLALYGFWALGSVAALGFTNTNGNSTDQGWVCLAFTGVDNTTPIDATGTVPNSSTGSATVTANAVTVVTNGAWYACGLAAWNGGAWSASGVTVKSNAQSNEDASCGYNTTPKSPGSTGTVLFTTGGGSGGQVIAAMPFAMRPDAGAASPTYGDWLAEPPPRRNRIISLPY